MEKAFELEVGNVSSNLFQLIAASALNINKNREEGEKFLLPNFSVSINLISESQVNLELINQRPFVKSEDDKYSSLDVTERLIYKILYSSHRILAFSEARYFDSWSLDEEFASKLAIELLRSVDEYVETSMAIDIRLHKSKDIDNLYEFAFNPVSCFNISQPSSSVVNVRLTPFYQLITDDNDYKDISARSNNLVLNNDDHPSILASSLDKHGLGKKYIFNDHLYLSDGTNYVNVEYLFDVDLLKINKLYVTEDESAPENKHWIYISTNGVVYDKLLLEAPIMVTFKDKLIETISYSAENVSIEVHIDLERLGEDKNTEKVPVTVSLKSTDKNETANLLICTEEDISKYEQDQNLIKTKELVSKLGKDDNYYDGKTFVKLLTRETIQREKMVEDRKKWEKENPTSAFFQNHGKQILVVAGIIIFLIIILAGC